MESKNKIQYFKLGEIAKIKRGERITKNQLNNNGKYIVISGGESIFGRFDKFNRNENTITIAQYGSAGYVNFIKEKFWANDVCYTLDCNDNIVNNKYLYYCLKNYQNLIYSLVINSVPKHLPLDSLKDLSIPIPSIQIQNKIVEILDKFSTYQAELVAELEAELESRKKQYSYYLNHLMDFKNEDVENFKIKEIADKKRKGNIKRSN